MGKLPSAKGGVLSGFNRHLNTTVFHVGSDAKYYLGLFDLSENVSSFYEASYPVPGERLPDWRARHDARPVGPR